MIWVDLAFRTAAVASAIVATLRAGSRVTYLMEHDGIGIMDGPTIQNTNDTYPLFELSEAFRHCVRLSISPEHYENVQTRKPVETVVEPYPLSHRPHLPQKRKEEDDVKLVTTDQAESLLNTTESHVAEVENRASFLSRQFRSIKRGIDAIPKTIARTVEYLAMTPQLVSYGTNRMWAWKEGRYKGSDSESDLEGDLEGEMRSLLLVVSKARG